MPPEPERPIEKLLRASAKRRREQAGDAWEIHPATRQVLQGEVARRFGRKREGKPGWFGWFLGQGWVRPMGALAGLGAVAVAVWISVEGFQSSKNPSALLAKNEQDRRTAAEPSAPAPPATDSASGRTERVDAGKSTKELLDDSAPALRQDESLAASAKQMELAKDKEIAAAPLMEKAQPSSAGQSQPPGQQGSAGAALGGANNMAPVAASQPPGAVLGYGLERELQPATAAPLTSSSAQPIVADSISQVSNALATALPPALPNETQKKVALLSLNGSTDFVQYGYFAATQTPSRIGRSFQLSRETETTARSKAAGPSGLQAPLGNQILVSFRVEQSGSLLRIVDQDGSVYAGPIQAGNAAFAPTAAQSSGSLGAVPNAKLPVATGLPAVSNLSQQPAASVFRVAGTNRTSNQRVTFSGTLTMGGSPVGAFAAKGATAGDRPAAPVQTTNMSLQDLRVFGKAVIGAGQTIDIQAVPVPGQATGNP
jgi:hypothetical protein